MAVNWFFCTSFKNVIQVLSSQRADWDPSFSKKVILGYLETKHKKGLNNSQIALKLDLVEQAMYERQLPDRTNQIIEIREELHLPPSVIFLACNIALDEEPLPQAAVDSRLYLPYVSFEREENSLGLPAYTPLSC